MVRTEVAPCKMQLRSFLDVPIYEFVCQKCENEFEKVVSFSETTMPACPACTSDEVQRQMGVPAIHFKGSGWYINDSKEKKGKEDESSSKDGQGEKEPVEKSGDESKSTSSDSKDEAAKSDSSSGSKDAPASTKKETTNASALAAKKAD